MADKLKAPFPLWADIPGFSGYEASRDGGIRRVWRNAMNITCERALKPFEFGKGYLGVSLRVGGKTHRGYVHQLVALAFLGPCPDGQEVCHGDGERKNNALDNLRYDTRKGNLADRNKHGTHQRGQQNPMAKLTDDQARAVKEMRDAGRPLREIAERFGVRESTVSRIANGKRRKEVEGG